MRIDDKVELLERAIQRARANGWEDGELQAMFPAGKDGAPPGGEFMRKALAHSPHSIIFRHDFAKALWGDRKILEEYPLSDGSGEYLKIYMPAWQAHLRKMVIAEEPLLYLAESQAEEMPGWPPEEETE